MKRWLPWMLLFLAVGFNLGLFGAQAMERWRETDTSEPSPEAPVELEEEAGLEEPAVAENDRPEEAAFDSDASAPEEPAGPDVPEAQAAPERRAAPPPPAGLPPRLERLADTLGLAGEAREEFLDLQRTFFREVVERRGELERLQRAVQREVMSKDPDSARIREGLDRVGQAYARLDAAFVQNILRSREFLEPEQEKRFLELLGRMRLRAQGGEGGRLRQRPGRQGRRPATRRP